NLILVLAAHETAHSTAPRARLQNGLHRPGDYGVNGRPRTIFSPERRSPAGDERDFDEEHTIRFCKQTRGWTAPKIRSPAAADRWTWLIVAAHSQLRLARRLAHDLRRPWERPLPPDRLTPARVRRGFRRLRTKTPSPASAPKPAHPGPGRPPGLKNTHRATRYDIGKTITRAAASPSDQQVKG
ncbi:MAG: uncharacterized protein K0Q93_3242, partial [Nocardioidaceae bacterium]|nr:uncharacterized protein [Nocardioidaceae bacterium]